jgi:glycosyltransferase involved in cell wall biosynthesis
MAWNKNICLYLKMFPALGDELNNGAVKYVHGFASGLVACGAKVTVLCEGSNSQKEKDSSYQTDAGYEIKWFSNSRNHLSFKLSNNLRASIKDGVEWDFVILNGIFHPSVYTMSKLLQKQNIPYIVAPLDPYHPSIFRKNAHLKWSYWYLFERRMLKQAKAIQLLDIRHLQWLYDLGISIQAIETPCGFSGENFYSEPILQWKENEEHRLLFLGRIDAHNKGLDLLLKAFAEITVITNTHLTIQGPDNGDRKALERIATQLSVSERTSFLGPDFNASATSIIANHDIFCIPSRFEGFSIAALEAMLAGRILLVSEVAGIAPHVQASGCGVVVKPEVVAIKEGLLELLQQRARWKEMGLNGRKYVLEYLSWDKIASNALERYQEIFDFPKASLN